MHSPGHRQATHGESPGSISVGEHRGRQLDDERIRLSSIDYGDAVWIDEPQPLTALPGR